MKQHKALINSLLDNEYIYLYDGRFRYAVIYCPDSDLYDIVVCSTQGHWYTIDMVFKSEIDKAVWSCLNAVISAYPDNAFDSDLFTLGIKRC